eukprot:GEMP01024552.1.p1 GENE.GEMP01024552.1~~GEMP01024552.1.p1  ORF type:complete len:291 (+),score=64.31 GEMP01024552.1:260-1132(+)
MIGVGRNATLLEQVHEYEWADNAESPPPLWKQRAALGGNLLPGEEYEIEFGTACTTTRSSDNQSETCSTTSDQHAHSGSSERGDAETLESDVPFGHTRGVTRDTVSESEKDELADHCCANFPARDQCICRRRRHALERCCKAASSPLRKCSVSAISSDAAAVSCISADSDIAMTQDTRDDAEHRQRAVDGESKGPSEVLEMGERAPPRSAPEDEVAQQVRPPDDNQEEDLGRTREVVLPPLSRRKIDLTTPTIVPIRSPSVKSKETIIRGHKRSRSKDFLDETPLKRMCT